MFNIISRFITALQNFIDQIATEAKDAHNPETSPIILLANRFRKKTRISPQTTPPTNLRQRVHLFATNRWQLIRGNLQLVVFVIILLGVVYFSERTDGDPWWFNQGQNIQNLETWLAQLWAEYQISIVVFSLVFIFILFGYNWLIISYKWFLKKMENLWAWSISHIIISLTLVFVLILLITYTFANINTWVFSSVEVWSEDELGHTSQTIAIQFRGNLNAIGSASFDSIARSVPAAPPIVAKAKRSVTPLEFKEHCPEIMLGPQSFTQVGEPISLSRSSAVSNEGTGGGEISLNTTVGTFNLPLEGLIRFLLRNTANYTELSAQIIPADRSTSADTIRIIVNANDGRSWSAEGRREELSQLINYLAHRLILDLQDNPSNEPLSEAELAMALGHQAYTAENYDAALAYYRLAEKFQHQDNTLQAMLGLIQYYLSARATSQTDKKSYQEGAEHAFNQIDTQDEQSNIIDLYPYLACFHNKLGHLDTAKEYLDNFNITLNPETAEAKAQRIAELKNKPPLGTSQILAKLPALNPNESYNLYYIANNAINYALDQPYNTTQITVTVRPLDETPHQIFVTGNKVFYITPDGLVNFFTPNNPDQTSIVFGVDDLQFEEKKEYTGGIRQIIATDEYVFMVDQFGRVLRLRDDGNGRWSLETFSEIDARQIVLLDDNTALYTLKEDGTVWRINDPLISDLKPTRQVVFDTDNREIVVARGVIYARRSNGNIWRYIDGESADLGLLIDRGVQTRKIILTSQGLFVLKNSGDVWLIRNPQQPAPKDIIELDLPKVERVAVAIVGSNLIALERNDQADLEPKIYRPLQLSTDDDDGDGLTNREELDLTTNHQNPDTDGDGLLDGDEVKIFGTNPLEVDTDNDTLRDWVEINTLGLDPLSPDTDADGLSDGEETEERASKTDPLLADTDSDGLLDGQEIQLRLDPTNPDTDSDGLPDGEEIELGSNPANPDTDSDGIPDGNDPDPLQPAPTPTATLVPTPTVTPTATATPQQPASARDDGAEEALIKPNEQDNTTWFWLDRTEVTNQQYSLCVESGNCAANAQDYADLFYEDEHPVVGVNWQQAQAYCEWVGGRLPTANEWRSAASPGEDPYPWGDSDPTCEQALIRGCEDEQAPGTRPVGSRTEDTNPYRLVDMFGNVWEWTATPGTGRDDLYVTLGGSWDNPDNTPKGGFASFNPPPNSNDILAQEEEYQRDNQGFRCARDYQPDTR